jgi:hypothetical protein
MNPEGLGTKKGCVGEGQQQSTRLVYRIWSCTSLRRVFGQVTRCTIFYPNIWGYNSAGIATSYGLEDRDSIPGRGKTSSSPQRPDWLWGPPTLLCNGYWGLKAVGTWTWPFFSIWGRQRMVELYLYSPVFMTWCLIKDRANFTLYRFLKQHLE